MSDINNDSDYDNESGEDSTSQSDSEFSGSETGITEDRPDYQGALVRANKALGDIFNDMDPDDSSWIDANYQRDIGLKIEIDYTANGGVCLMENLRRKVFNELNNYPIASTNQSSSTTSPLETTRAYNISWAFFKNMVDPVCDRVHAIIHAHASLSAVQAATAKAQHQDSATPEVVGDMDRTLAALLGTDAKTTAISTLRHQIELYRLDKRWGDIKRLVSDSPLTPEGAGFLSGCPPSSRGESNISRAMAAICNIMEMDKAAFQFDLKNAAVLSALVQVWGRGGIMFAHWQPRSGPGGRSYPFRESEAKQIFEAIKAVDTYDVLQRLADCLDILIVQYIWEDKPILWDSERLVALDPKMPILPLLEAMNDTIDD